MSNTLAVAVSIAHATARCSTIKNPRICLPVRGEGVRVMRRGGASMSRWSFVVVGPKKIRTVQIAVSAVCLLACALIVALWVRSYWTADVLRWAGSGKVTLILKLGTVTFTSSTVQFSGAPTWQWESTPTEDMMPDSLRDWRLRVGNSAFIRFPFCLPVAIFLLSAIAPWIRWHFSLRALLIAIAVIALLLGLALYH